MNRCDNCGRILATETCDRCGFGTIAPSRLVQSLPPIPVQSAVAWNVKCPRCQAFAPGDAKFCGQCGGRMMGPTSAADDQESAPAQRLESIPPGTSILGRFLVERRLGEGGMASVLLATDTRLDRRVALKVLSSELFANERARQRMEREAKSLARVRHPNVVDLYDIFNLEARIILSLEYLPGGSMAELQLPIARPQALEYLKHILGGLGALHEQSLVHRDIKPGNILLTESNVAKVADLGIARNREDRERITRDGTKLGTPNYMSPEQIRGRDADLRADIYSCGILAYEILTGALPFAGASDHDIEWMHINKTPDPAPLRALAGDPLTDVIFRAVEKNTEDRWSSAGEFMQALAASG